MQEQEAPMEIHVYTVQGIRAMFLLFRSDTVKTLFSILKESFSPAAENQSGFQLFFKSGDTGFKYYRYGRMSKLRFLCRTCRKEFNFNMPTKRQLSPAKTAPPPPKKCLPPPPPHTVASSSSSSSVLELSDRVLDHCKALHEYNAQLQLEKSTLEMKNKALEQALTSLEASHRFEIHALRMERDAFRQERDDTLRKFEAVLHSYNIQQMMATSLFLLIILVSIFLL